MSERITTERVRELLAVDGTRRLLGGVLLDAALVRDLAADLLDARASLAAECTRREAAEASATRSADAAVDAVRELGHVAAAAVARADAAEAEVVRLREYIDDCGRLAVGLVERVHRAVETHQVVVRERDAARAMADGLRVDLTAALAAVAEERARCAAVCREVACFYHQEDVGSVVARACADEIERESVSALLRTPGA